MTNTADGRELAFAILTEVLEQGQYSHVALRQALSKYQYLDKVERSFITRLVEGTLEYLIQIDYVIDSFSKVKVKKQKPAIRTILRMSVYQILYMDRVPDSAACDEGVKLAARHHFQGLKGFVNGVLRSIARNKHNLTWPNLSIAYGIPQWILDLWGESYSEEAVKAMLEASLAPSKLAVRCNLHKASREQILESLALEQVEAVPSEISDSVLYLSGYDYLEALKAYENGWITVQDASSSLVAELAPVKAGDYVIDVCGAPGGKSLHVADRLDGTGTVDVRDISQSKVELIGEAVRRTGFSNVKVKVWDALVLDGPFVEKADIVLADLPCSGLGVMGRKPDIKQNMTMEKARELADLQRRILSVVWRYVKPDGYLLYSTCTVNPHENQENVRWFQENFPFQPVSIEGKLGERVKESSMKEGFLQLLPGVHPCDGFFLALFQRK